MVPATGQPRRICFEVFEVDLKTGELFDGDVKTQLQEKPFQILSLLLEHPGEILTREEIQRRLWSEDTFVDFEHGINSAVGRLRHALGDSANKPRFIETVGRRGYRFISPVGTVAPGSSPDIPAAAQSSAIPVHEKTEMMRGEESPVVAGRLYTTRMRVLALAAVGIVALIAVLVGLSSAGLRELIRTTGFWLHQAREEGSEAPMLPVPFTAHRGLVWTHCISYDGKQVAFAWDGDTKSSTHIYIKQIGSDSSRQLTFGPHKDDHPAWSPDGLYVAFQRYLSQGKSDVMLISANGGGERQLAQFDTASGICWHPGGKWLAVAGKDSADDTTAMHVISLQTGERRRLTSPPKGGGGERDPAFSPDGHHLAFSRSFAGPPVSEIFVLRVSAGLSPEGEPKQLTLGDRMARSPSWLPDGKDLIFTFGSKALYCRLWRISVSASEKPTPLPFSGEGVAIWPSVSFESHRLVYNVWSWDFNLWRYEVPGSRTKPAPPSRFIPSSQTQELPQYSPDGRRVAYVSYASGCNEIWISNSDGSNPLQLTHLVGPTLESPRWSPDGKQIVFSMASRDQTELFMIPAQGGQAKQLTPTPFNKGKPSYSRDGKWIYFRWQRGGDAQIWKMPVDGGEPLQVTKKGGSIPLESVDGRTLFYLKGNTKVGSLWMVPVGGGEETKAFDDIWLENFDVKEHGIYYISGTDGEKTRFSYYDLISRKTAHLAPIQGNVEFGFTVSPDERWFLLNQGGRTGSNLMLVENFR